MDLLIDIGNTNLKWAPCQARRLGPVAKLSHREGLGALWDAWRDTPTPDRVLVANVAGADLEAKLAPIVRGRWGLEPGLLRTQAEAHGVTVAYPDPSRLGVDRWLTLIAVRHFHSTPALVVDCGTAMTLDAIDAQGRHLGGMIAPGLGLMRHSLFAGTRIPAVSQMDFRGLLGQDTAECIAAGTLHALAGLVVRVQAGLRAERGWEPQVLLCGSDAALLAGLFEFQTTQVSDLVLQGLSVF